MKCSGAKTQAEHDMIVQCNSHGQWEEFHQKKGNGTMFSWHKERRLELEKKLRAMRELH